MNPTENRSAAVFFAEMLLPLRHANVRRGAAYLDRGPRRQGYWGDVASRTGGMERLSGAACDPTALLGQLGNYWTQRNEPDLLQLLPYLERLREELVNTARADDQTGEPVTDFVYPLF
jgi:hypothetical protein